MCSRLTFWHVVVFALYGTSTAWWEICIILSTRPLPHEECAISITLIITAETVALTQKSRSQNSPYSGCGDKHTLQRFWTSCVKFVSWGFAPLLPHHRWAHCHRGRTGKHFQMAKFVDQVSPRSRTQQQRQMQLDPPACLPALPAGNWSWAHSNGNV